MSLEPQRPVDREGRAVRTIALIVALIVISAGNLDAGGFRHRKPAGSPEVPPTRGAPGPSQMVTPNGVVVPAWASRRIAESPVPLYGKSWGRRPWALPLATQGTSSAYWARLDQLGFGAGPTPGYTNGPGLGNLPSAPIGPDGGPLARPGFRSGLGFPFSPWVMPGN